MNSNKSNNKGCFSAILGTLAIIAAVAVYAVLSSLLNNLVITLRLGDKNECALLSLSLIGVFIAFVLFDIIFIVWQWRLAKKGSEGYAKTDRLFKIVLAVCLSAVVIFPFISANTYTSLSEDRISKVFFAEYKSYDIDTDISRCTLACTSDGALSYTLTMSDGERIELFGSVSSCGDGFVERYENLYGYASEITEGLRERGITPRIIGEQYMQDGYRDSHPEVWKYLEQMIKEAGN